MFVIRATLRWVPALWQNRIGCSLRQGVHGPLLLAFCLRLFRSPPTVRHCLHISTPYSARFMLAIRYSLLMRSVGGDLSPIAVEQNHSPWSGRPGRGSYLNAYRWFGYATDPHANTASFNSIEELLRSGLARRGGLVLFIYIISMLMIVISDFSGATRQVRIYFGMVISLGIESQG